MHFKKGEGFPAAYYSIVWRATHLMYDIILSYIILLWFVSHRVINKILSIIEKSFQQFVIVRIDHRQQAYVELVEW